MDFDQWLKKTMSRASEEERKKLNASQKFAAAVAKKDQEEAGRILCEILYGDYETNLEARQKRKFGTTTAESWEYIFQEPYPHKKKSN